MADDVKKLPGDISHLQRLIGSHAAERGDKHGWPPRVTVYDSWRVPFAALARENRFTPGNIDEAASTLEALVAAIGPPAL